MADRPECGFSCNNVLYVLYMNVEGTGTVSLCVCLCILLGSSSTNKIDLWKIRSTRGLKDRQLQQYGKAVKRSGPQVVCDLGPTCMRVSLRSR